MQKNGWCDKPLGKFIFPPQSTFFAPNSMCPRQTQFTSDTFFFHTTLKGVVGVENHTNMLWSSSMWPAVLKKPSRWPRKTLLRLQAENLPSWTFEISTAPHPGRELMGAVTKEMEKHKTNIWRRRTEIHRDQAIVERFKRTLAECLFGHQYAVEMRLPAGQRSSEWVVRLPAVVSALNSDIMT